MADAGKRKATSSARARRPGLWRDAFLAALAQTGNVTEACKAAGVNRVEPYKLRDSDSAFDSRWQDALHTFADRLEKEAVRRAVEGTLKPVFQQGREVGRIREFSDNLLLALLRAKRPDQYRERLDVTITDLRKQAEKLVKELGGAVTAEELIAEAERIVKAGV